MSSSSVQGGVRTITHDAYDGAEDGWRGALPIRDYDEEAIRLDLTAIRFVTPTYLLRLRSFVDWHCQRGRTVAVLAPRQQAVANYMARMRIARGCPDTAGFVNLPTVRETNQQRVLIPVTKLLVLPDVDNFVGELGPLLQAHSTGAAMLMDPIEMAMSELCGNAVEHGKNEVGCLVAAQRYKQTGRVEIAIGDLGVGIPSHMRRRHRGIGEDAQVIVKAMKEGVTGTGEARVRGRGFYWVFDSAEQAQQLERARLRIRSSKGIVTRSLASTGRITTRAQTAPHKSGTWITYELYPRRS